jgi:hypothetical protein
MMRIGFAGYGSAPALEDGPGRLAISAGAASSLMAWRRLQCTGGTSNDEDFNLA